MKVRVANKSDLDGITETLSLAFAMDPFWGWAFPDPDGLRAMMAVLAGGALRYPWTWIADNYAAVAVWIPPGGIELTESEEDAAEEVFVKYAGSRAAEVVELFNSFENNHPRDREHYYLSILATHPDHRGRGLGMALLADNLARIDQESASAYLESSNPVNINRYEAQGFRKVDEFDRPDGNAVATTMWREAR